ncbi:MAG TPA: hypothetical protein DEP84_17050, partial [Chloroflexi bacterium]|nr:hypothetical protein [Chloroflexota bacterium]
MRILYLTGREPEYPRNQIVERALRRRHEVVRVVSSARHPLRRNLAVFARFIQARGPFDVVFCGFYGQPLMLWLRWLTRRPVLFDAFFSTHDTLVVDRQFFHPGSPGAWAARWLDVLTCRWADHVLVDTESTRRYFVETLGVPSSHLDVLYTSADESLFQPSFPSPRAADQPFTVFTSIGFLPLHGVGAILDAAELLRESSCRIVLAGDGPGLPATQTAVARRDLPNIRLPGWIEYRTLPDHIARADLCLGGHFGPSEKARRHIPVKAFQYFAMRRPVILGDNAANRELFAGGHDCVMVPHADPAALAAAIDRFRGDAAEAERLAA